MRIGEEVRLAQRIGRVLLPGIFGIHGSERRVDPARDERRVGVVLVTLPDGEHLLPIAKRILGDAETARAQISEIAGLSRGRIRIGATPTLCASLVADVLTEFHGDYPGVTIEILERGSRSLITALLEGSLDLALIVTSVSSESARAVLELEPILQEPLVAVSAAPLEKLLPSHTDTLRTAATPLELRELAALPQVIFPKNYDLRVTIDTAFHAADLTPNVAVEGAEMDAALRFAERGIGVAVVPAMIAAQHPTLTATPLADPALVRTVSIARRTDMAPSRASRVVQELIREVAGELTRDNPVFSHQSLPDHTLGG